MCGSPAGSSLALAPWRIWTPLLVSTVVPSKPALLTVSSSHFSIPTPLITRTFALAIASRSAGEGS
jgi:hypothetical protein